MALAAVFALAACQEPAGDITRDARPFDGIGEAATISVLGNEPFWNIQIEPDIAGYRATYSTPESIDGTSFPVSRFAGNNGLGFAGDIDGRSMQLALTPGDCSDGMSDRVYPYTATVLVGETTLYGCGYTSEEPFENS